MNKATKQQHLRGEQIENVDATFKKQQSVGIKSSSVCVDDKAEELIYLLVDSNNELYRDTAIIITRFTLNLSSEISKYYCWNQSKLPVVTRSTMINRKSE